MFYVSNQQCQEDHDVLPEQIKAVLLDTAGYAGLVWLRSRRKHLCGTELDLSPCSVLVSNFLT